MQTVSYVAHDSIGYVFFSPAAVNIRNDTQSGSWKLINASSSDSLLTSDVFSLWIDHGLKPTNAGYAYITLPAAASEEVAAYAQKNPVRVVANTDSLQAVWHDTLRAGGAVFHKAGSVTFAANLSLSVDKPCAVLIEEKPDSIQVSVASPQCTSYTVTALARVKRTNRADTTIAFSVALPSGQFAGSSVIRQVYSGALYSAARTVRPASSGKSLRILLDGSTGGYAIDLPQKMTGARELTIALYNVAGRRIIETRVQNAATVRLGGGMHIPAGIYTLRIGSAASGMVCKKIVL